MVVEIEFGLGGLGANRVLACSMLRASLSLLGNTNCSW